MRSAARNGRSGSRVPAPGPGLLFRSGDEGLEELPGISVIGRFFRMPLYGDQKLVCPGLKGFDNPVARYGGEMEPPAGVFHALMMRAPHADAGCAEDAREHRAFQNIDVVKHLLPGAGGAVLYRVRDLLADVLIQSAAERNIDELRAIADGEERFLGFRRGLEKTDLEQGPPVGRERHARTGKRFLLVEPGIDVVAAGEDKTVKTPDQIGDGALDAEDRHRNA